MEQGTQFICQGCYQANYMKAIDPSTRSRELTHGPRVDSLQKFVIEKKEAIIAAKEKNSESRAASKGMEDAARGLLISLDFLPPAHTKQVWVITMKYTHCKHTSI
jgi:hypothetical protein